MSEQTPEQPQGGIPQDVADDLSVLASEVRAAEMRAARGWKIALVFWVILLAVIAGYLYFLIYKPLKENLQPDAVVEMGFDMLRDRVGHDIGSPQFAQWAAAELKNNAPRIMRDYVKPQVEDLIAELPRVRAEAVARIQAEAPRLMDQGVEWIETQVLPQASNRLLQVVQGQLNGVLDQVDEDMDQIVADAVESVAGDVETLRDRQKLRVAMHGAFEDAMGDVLDEMLAEMDMKVGSVRQEMKGLVADYKAGDLTHEQQLEIRLIQLVRALFEEGLDEAIEEQAAAMEELRGLLDKLDLPEDISLEVIGAAAGTGEMPGMENVPPEARARIEAAAGRARAARQRAMRRAPQPTGEGAAPAGPPPGMQEMTEEMKKQAMERAEQAREQARQQQQ